MPDNLFDNFFNKKLNDRPAPVPDGLWDKLMDKQFDEFVGGKLKDQDAPVPAGLWDKVTDGQFDNFFGASLGNHTAVVPAGLWDKVTDGGFDRFFGDTLGNYTAPVPAGLWEKIRPEEKDDRKIFWLRIPAAAIFILAILLGGTAAYFWLRPQQGAISHDITHQPSPAIGTGNKGAKKETAPDATVTPNEPAKNEATVTVPQPSITNQAGKEAIVPAPLKGNGVPGSEKQNLNDLPPAGLSNTTISNSKNNRLPGNLQNSGHNNGSSTGLPTGNLFVADNGIPQIPQRSGAGTDSIVNKTDNGVTTDLPYQPAFLPAMTVPSGSSRKGWMDLTGKELENKKTSLKSNVICPTNRSNRNTDWLLEVYTSPDFAFKSVVNNSASQQYLQKKDSSERMQVGFTAGVRIVKPLTDNILLKTGLQYSQINQNYAYRTENEIKTTTVVTVRTIIRAPGDTVVVSDTSVLQTIGFKNNTVKNRFRSLDIPVILGYQFGDENLKFGINAGVIFNMSSWYEGVLLDSTLSVVPLTKSNNMVYKSKLGLGLYAGFSITKQLSEDLHVFVEPYFRYNLSNMTSAQSSFNQKFSVGGLTIGLKFNLNR